LLLTNIQYTNRKFIGIEKDEKYFEIARNRIKNPGQPIVKNSNGKLGLLDD